MSEPDPTQRGALDAIASERSALVALLRRGGLAAAVLTGVSGALSSAAPAAQAPGVTDPSTTSEASAEAPATTAPSSGESTTPTPVTTAPSTTDSSSTAPTSTVPSSTTTSSTTTTSTQTAPAPAKPPRKHSGKAPQALEQHSQSVTTTPTQTQTTAAPVAPQPASTAPAPTQSSAAIAPAPQLAAVQSNALAAMMSGSAASLQALDFYRIPLFLLPIYQAAAVQYGVPWQVLAAINEVETDFGTDLSVSTAGAVGWMQFMPETWLQYGVDALGAGYADPYNPVDAVFAAARYLHAAGASSNLRGAILAYNHSEAYAESVLLRARLFASYPGSAIATLTGLTEGSLPVADARLAPGSSLAQAQAPASGGGAQTGSGAASPPAPAEAPTGETGGPGSTVAPSPAASAAKAARALDAPAPATQLSKLLAKKGAPVVAVEDGRIVGIGVSRKIGEYLVLRDTYGDVFTYGGLGSIASAYHLAKPTALQVPKGALPSGESGSDPTPQQAASAGRQSPLTLHVAQRKSPTSAPAAASTFRAGQEGLGEAGRSARSGKFRVFAHPGNPDAVAAKRLREQVHSRRLAAGWALLRRGAVVAQGTVLGHLASSGEGKQASLRFAIRPAGAQSAIDPQPILENWRQLARALHPHGSKAGAVLAGATAADAFQLSRGELERAVLADPGIEMGACDRSQVAAGKVDPHALALLVFLSRSGLKPTVGELRCGSAVATSSGVQTVFPAPGTLDIAAINGVPIAGHQGAGTVADVTIRTLLTIKRRYAPKRIVSLMSYPEAPSTVAAGDRADYIQLEVPLAAPRRVAVAARSASGASSQTGNGSPAKVTLDTFEWQHLIDQVASIGQPSIASGPSAAAIRDARP